MRPSPVWLPQHHHWYQCLDGMSGPVLRILSCGASPEINERGIKCMKPNINSSIQGFIPGKVDSFLILSFNMSNQTAMI